MPTQATCVISRRFRCTGQHEDDLEDDPGHILISHNARNAEVFDVYRANIHTGE